MEVFVARQPILDRDEKLFGYELLFRDGLLRGAFSGVDPDGASSRIIAESATQLGPRSFAGGHVAFVNITRELLLARLIGLLPAEGTVFELLEDLEPDSGVLTACRQLKASGYRIALDDFTWEHRKSPLLECADIVKVDFLSVQPRERAAIARMLASRKITLLAEKVETYEAFREARDLGYRYFQGFFFSRPVMVASRYVPGVKIHYLEILREVQRPSLDFGAVERIVKSDVSLSYRLLRYANNVHFNRGQRMRSIGQALLVVGELEFRRLVTVLAMAGLAQDRPEALVTQALSRARFCELILRSAGRAELAEEAFLVGLFSLIDAMLGRPLAEILQQIPLTDRVLEALVPGRGELNQVLSYAVLCERGQWAEATALAGRIGLDESAVPQAIADAHAFGRAAFEERREAA